MKTAVIIPCYKVKDKILSVLSKIGNEIDRIIVVDDACPEATGNYVQENANDPRIHIVIHEKNKGVGGAMITGYQTALEMGADILVKLDGDGQMDPTLIPKFIKPILRGEADYTKGNRFFHPEYLSRMPFVRVIGNTVLSFLNKLISGYWDIMDPTNGYTAIHRSALSLIPLQKINEGYFFESDLLFRLNVARAVVVDVPMQSVYEDEKSNLKISRILLSFPFLYVNRFSKRMIYNYFLRDFNLGSVSLIFGLLMVGFGFIFGLVHWVNGEYTQRDATSGTVMLAALPIILGFQLLLFFLQIDVLSVPKKVLSKILGAF